MKSSGGKLHPTESPSKPNSTPKKKKEIDWMKHLWKKHFCGLPKNISSLFQKITNNEMLFYDFSNPKWKDERCSVYNSLFIHLKTAFGRTLNTPDLTRDEK